MTSTSRGDAGHAPADPRPASAALTRGQGPAASRPEPGQRPSPAVPGPANPHADAQVLVAEVAEDGHPHLPVHDVRRPVIQGQRVGWGADGRRPDHMSLHLDALGWGHGGRGPGDDSRWAAQAGPQLVPQLPGGAVEPLAEAVGALAEAQGPPGLLVLALGLRLDGLVVLAGQAALRLLDLLVELLAQLLAQLLVGEPPFPAHLHLLLLLGAVRALGAGPGCGGAGAGVVALPGLGGRLRQVILRLLLEASEWLVSQSHAVLGVLPGPPLREEGERGQVSPGLQASGCAHPGLPALLPGPAAPGLGRAKGRGRWYLFPEKLIFFARFQLSQEKKDAELAPRVPGFQSPPHPTPPPVHPLE